MEHIFTAVLNVPGRFSVFICNILFIKDVYEEKLMSCRAMMRKATPVPAER